MDSKHCAGCRNDFYNDKNPLGVKKCWSLENAKIVWRIPIGYWEEPPYLNKKKRRIPSCWHGEGINKILYVKSDRIDSRGHWR